LFGSHPTHVPSNAESVMEAKILTRSVKRIEFLIDHRWYSGQRESGGVIMLGIGSENI
jgi:hypothetical protein